MSDCTHIPWTCHTQFVIFKLPTLWGPCIASSIKIYSWMLPLQIFLFLGPLKPKPLKPKLVHIIVYCLLSVESMHYVTLKDTIFQRKCLCGNELLFCQKANCKTKSAFPAFSSELDFPDLVVRNISITMATQ